MNRRWRLIFRLDDGRAFSCVLVGRERELRDAANLAMAQWMVRSGATEPVVGRWRFEAVGPAMPWWRRRLRVAMWRLRRKLKHKPGR